MTITTIESKIGKKDLNCWDGITDSFARLTSTGSSLTNYKIGSLVDICSVYGDNTAKNSTILNTAIAAIGTSNRVGIELTPGTWDITDNVTFPSNIEVVCSPGATFNITAGRYLTFPAGHTIYSSWFGGITNLVAGVATTNNIKVVIDYSETLGDDLTCPDEFTIYQEPGKIITIPSDYVLTINGYFNCLPIQHCFTISGTGSVVFGLNSESYPEMFGFGGADDTQAIRDAITSLGSDGGVVRFARGYNITDDIYCPRNISLIGTPGKYVVIQSLTGNTIFITSSQGAGEWIAPTHFISDLVLSGVTVFYGYESTYNGANVTIDRCVFINTFTYGVIYRYNCWNTLISNCLFALDTATPEQHRGTCVLYQYLIDGSPILGSGSNVRIVNTILSHANKGVEVQGSSQDGVHIQMTNVDMEYLYYGVFVQESYQAAGVVIDMVACHGELNILSHVANDGANINIIGGWYFTPTDTDVYVAHFLQTCNSTVPSTYPDQGRILIDGATIGYDEKQFCYIYTGASGTRYGDGILIKHGTEILGTGQLYADLSIVPPQFIDNMIESGTTAERSTLTANDRGYSYWDTTIGKLIIWDGSAWKLADGTAP